MVILKKVVLNLKSVCSCCFKILSLVNLKTHFD